MATTPATAAVPARRPMMQRARSATLVRHLGIALIAGLVLYVVSNGLSAFDNLQLATMAYYFTAVAGLTVLTGVNGQVSLGHGAFMAVGAYTTAKLLGDGTDHLPLALVLLLAAVISGVAGVIAGAAAARLRGPYLAGATLALAVGLPSIADRFPGFLGASNGLTVIPSTPPASLGATFPLERWQAWITCLGALVVYVLLANLMRSRFGRAFRAVRDDEIAAELAGLHVARTQVLAFVVSAACAGLGGGLFVVVTQLAAPGAFQLSLSVALLAGVVLGGLGSLWGAALGAAALVLIPQWSDSLSKSLSLSDNVQANLALAVYGLLLIGVILLAPRGLAGAFDRAGGLIRSFWVHNRTRRATPRRGEEQA
ncbi:MAG TPA: branched-chain amino acid ABC transporter permease [Baekduia sp.]|jgi:branched-chain amino acid transport system permease protein|nr:branched-chain amino acid ABC transporter permease [Baekduia sp.]